MRLTRLSIVGSIGVAGSIVRAVMGSMGAIIDLIVRAVVGSMEAVVGSIVRSIVGSMCPMKEDNNNNQTRITNGENSIDYLGDCGTKTGLLKLVKLMVNSVCSRPNAKFMTMDLGNFYLRHWTVKNMSK